MDKYEFKTALLPKMIKSFEKVRAWYATGDEARAQEVADIWFEVLRSVRLQDALEAVGILMRDENQPRQVEGYPRRILSIITEMRRTAGPRPHMIPDHEYYSSLRERLNYERELMGLSPLTQAQADAPASWPPDPVFLEALFRRYPNHPYRAMLNKGEKPQLEEVVQAHANVGPDPEWTPPVTPGPDEDGGDIPF